MVDSRPILNVCIPVFNKASTLGRTLLSLRQQNLKNFTVTILDNGSTDAFAECLAEYGVGLPITLYKVPKCISILDSWVLALSLGEGKYTRLLLGGDTMPANSLTVLIDALEQNPWACLACGKSRLVSQEGDWVHSESEKPANEFRKRISGPLNLAERVKIYGTADPMQNHFLDAAFVFRSEFIEDLRSGIRKCTAVFETWPDLEMWLRLLQVGPFVYVDEFVSDFYMGDHSHRDPENIEKLFPFQSLKYAIMVLADPDFKILRSTMSDRARISRIVKVIGYLILKQREVPASGPLVKTLIAAYYLFRFPLVVVRTLRNKLLRRR